MAMRHEIRRNTDATPVLAPGAEIFSIRLT
jgi:hypothetical protein